MSGNAVQVLVGVVNGIVNAKVRWDDTGRFEDMHFEPKEAYEIGIALSKAAMEAHAGQPVGGADDFIRNESLMKITDEGRARILVIVGKMVRSLMDQGKSPEQITMHAVDFVLQETTR